TALGRRLRSTGGQILLHLFRRANQQLIANLGLRRVDRAGTQLQYARSPQAERSDSKRAKRFHQMYDAMVGIQIDQVGGEEDAQTVNSLRRDHPNPLVWLQSNSSNKPPQPGYMRIRDNHIEAQARLAC